MRITEVADSSIGETRKRGECDTADICNRALRLKKGRALKIYAPKKADVIGARLYSYARLHKLPLQVNYKKNTIWVSRKKVEASGNGGAHLTAEQVE